MDGLGTRNFIVSNMWWENIILLMYLGHDFRANVRHSSIWVVIRFPYYLCMDLPFMFSWRFYPPSFYAHAFYQEKKHLQVLDWSRPKAAFLSRHPTPSPPLTVTLKHLQDSPEAQWRSLFIAAFFSCPSKNVLLEEDAHRETEWEKKGYLPRVIRARLLKGKGQFGVISLCPQVSFGTWQADCSTRLKQVSLDIEDLETGGGQ